ncbi:hypothetical protein CVT24_002081 [Panaeolus cyanescens]|uniref:Extracellular metalloproteinase n=1 Tax=Panaeolus cyanescens TaxID=181874 RepID=A0A409W1L4_9AGAR|nr:hypothetical protein CVT24_002081 [Panaeolus cyanescens]
MLSIRIFLFLLLWIFPLATSGAYFMDQDEDLTYDEDFEDENYFEDAIPLPSLAQAPQVELDYFHPEVQYITYEDQDAPVIQMYPSLQEDSIRTSVVNFVQEYLSVEHGQVVYQSGYSADDVHYAYVAQAKNGIPFINAVANLAIYDGRVVSFGSSFVKPDLYAPSNPAVSINDAIRNAEEALHGTYNQHPVTVNYLARPDNSAALVYTIQIENEPLSIWKEAHVDAHSGAVLSAIDFVDESSYRAVPIDRQSILDGTRRIRNPQNYRASRLGWHNDGEFRRSRTQGNNVLAHRYNRTTRQSSRGLRFHYKYDTRRRPSHRTNIRASTTNAFYVMNAVHDFTYLYGFTEKAFNFQHTNFGLGGKDNDSVTVSVQDPTRVNNANFATPPDGQSGRAKFFIYDGWRDSAMDNSLLVHEYTHGITNRMTGGGTARCLKDPQSKGLGEGWSDAMADWTEQRGPTIKDLIQGVYVKNNFERGIRHYPYSVDKKINPLLFSHLNKLSEVHAVGEIWANVLHQVHTSLVQRHGFSSSARSNPNTQHGNVVFLHLFIDALALQPCNPNFMQARDAWLKADQNRYRGRHKCLLWKAFAFRGMGVDAKGAKTPPYVDGFKFLPGALDIMGIALVLWLLVYTIHLPLAVQCLKLSINATVSLGLPANLTWIRDDFDLPSLVFDLRFMQEGQDVGLASAGVVMEPEQVSGTVAVRFQEKGLYTLVAVVTNSDSDTPEQIAESNRVAVLSGFTPTPSIPRPTTTPTSTATESSNSNIKHSNGINLGAIVGGVIGGLVLLAMLGVMFMVIRRRSQALRRRVTFHRDRMFTPNPDQKATYVNGSPMPHLMIVSASATEAASHGSSEDLESNLSPKTPLMTETQDSRSSRTSTSTRPATSYHDESAHSGPLHPKTERLTTYHLQTAHK